MPGGLFGTVRVSAMVEEHGDGKQLCRFRSWPKAPDAVLVIFFVIMLAAGLGALNHAAIAASFLTFTGGAIALLVYKDCAHAMGQWRDAIDSYLGRNPGLSIVPNALPR